MSISLNGSKKMGGGEAIALLVMCVLLIVPAILLRAWAASVVWHWFLVPAGLPTLTFSAFVGAVLLKALLFQTEKKADPDASAWSAFGDLVGTAFLAPGLLLLFAWVARAIVL